MHLLPLAKSRRAPIFLAAAALVTVGTTLSTLVPTPQASAQEGRRICRYLWTQSVGNPEGRLVSLVIDYKEKGKCPDINPLRVKLPTEVAAWMPSPEAWEPGPAAKITCEQLQSKLELPINGNSEDPCYRLNNDVLYAVTSRLETDSSYTRRIFPIGHAKDLSF